MPSREVVSVESVSAVSESSPVLPKIDVRPCSDSTTSYGSYSGAVPNEKITWGKLAIDTPKFVIESDATIVAPLIFAFVLDQ